MSPASTTDRRRRSAVAGRVMFLAGVTLLWMGCGGSSGDNTGPGGGGTPGEPPPASVASITPAQGFPAAPAIGEVLPPPDSIPALPDTIPGTPTGVALTADQITGPGLPDDVANAIDAAFSPLPAGALVFGTLAGYTTNGIVVATEPLITPDSTTPPTFAATAPGQPTPDTLTVGLNSTTLDAVASKTTVAAAQLGATVGRTQARSSGSTRRVRLLPASAALGPDVTSFTLSGTTEIQPGRKWEDLGRNLGLPIRLPFGTVDVTADFYVTSYEAMDYPLMLHGLGDPGSYVEDVLQTLPLAIANVPSGPSAINYGLGWVLAIRPKACLRFDRGLSSGLPVALPVNICQLPRSTAGYQQVSKTAAGLPARFALTRLEGPSVTFALDVSTPLVLMLESQFPDKKQELAAALKQGRVVIRFLATVDASIGRSVLQYGLAITNADPATGDVMFSVDDNAGPTFAVLPHSASDGSVQTNVVTLTPRDPPFVHVVGGGGDPREAELDLKVDLPATGAQRDYVLDAFPDPSAFSKQVHDPKPLQVTLVPSPSQGGAISLTVVPNTLRLNSGGSGSVSVTIMRNGSTDQGNTATIFAPLGCGGVFSTMPVSAQGPIAMFTVTAGAGPFEPNTSCDGDFTVGATRGILQVCVDNPQCPDLPPQGSIVRTVQKTRPWRKVHHRLGSHS